MNSRRTAPKSPEWYAALDEAAVAGDERITARVKANRTTPLISQETLNRVAEEHAEFLKQLAQQSDTSESNNEYHMTVQTTNTEFTIDALSTESVVQSIRANPEQLMCAMKTFVAASQILDQFKRNFYYGDKGDFDPVKLQHYIEEIRKGAFELDYSHIIYKESQKDVAIDTRVAHGILGAATESGELVEAAIKFIEGEGDFVNLKEEVGDVHWYLAVLADALDLTTDQCLEAVIKKLKDKKKGRYASGVFTEDAAVDRNTTAERELLEE